MTNKEIYDKLQSLNIKPIDIIYNHHESIEVVGKSGKKFYIEGIGVYQLQDIHDASANDYCTGDIENVYYFPELDTYLKVKGWYQSHGDEEWKEYTIAKKTIKTITEWDEYEG